MTRAGEVFSPTMGILLMDKGLRRASPGGRDFLFLHSAWLTGGYFWDVFVRRPVRKIWAVGLPDYFRRSSLPISGIRKSGPFRKVDVMFINGGFFIQRRPLGDNAVTMFEYLLYRSISPRTIMASAHSAVPSSWAWPNALRISVPHSCNSPPRHGPKTADYHRPSDEPAVDEPLQPTRKNCQGRGGWYDDGYYQLIQKKHKMIINNQKIWWYMNQYVLYFTRKIDELWIMNYELWIMNYELWMRRFGWPCFDEAFTSKT